MQPYVMSEVDRPPMETGTMNRVKRSPRSQGLSGYSCAAAEEGGRRMEALGADAR